MNFGEALTCLQNGQKVQRESWVDTFVTFQKGYPDGVPINRNTSEALSLPEGTVCRFSPYFLFRTSDGVFVPWVAPHTDLLATDWRVVQAS